MSDKLKNSVQAWLDKQGYPLEMLVARTFRQAEASVSQSTYYVDPEAEKPREIDVLARWSIFDTSIDDALLLLNLSFFIECKSQQKSPWIIFTDNAVREEIFRRGVSLPSTSSGMDLLFLGFVTEMSAPPRMWQMQDTAGYGITQAFESKVDVPYQALMSCIKAATDEIRYREKLNEASAASDLLGYKIRLYPTIAIPVVVTDATLFECYLDDNALPVLNEMTSCCVDWKYPLQAETWRLRGYNPAFIYNVSVIDQLLKDAIELRQKLTEILPQFLQREINKYEKQHEDDQ